MSESEDPHSPLSPHSPTRHKKKKHHQDHHSGAESTMLPPIGGAPSHARAASPWTQPRGVSQGGSRTCTPSESTRPPHSREHHSRSHHSDRHGHGKEGMSAMVLMSHLQDDSLDIDGIEDMLRHNQHARKAINEKEPCFGWTALHTMAHRGQAHILNMLIDCKARLDVTCNLGNTPLHLAARGNHPRALELLVARSASLDCQNNNGWSALLWAAMCGHEQLLPALLSSGANTEILDCEGRSAVMWAARHGHGRIVTSLFSRGAQLEARDYNGLSVIDHAREHRDLRKMLKPMLAANNALLQAARCNDVMGAMAALENDAFVNARDGEGATAIGWASYHDNVAMVRLLISHGADPNLVDMRPVSSPGYHTANDWAKVTVSEAVKMALHIGDDLIRAAKDNDLEGLKDALNNGAWANSRDRKTNVSALSWAVGRNNPEMVMELVARDADMEARDACGWTAMHSAVINASNETLSALHCNNADVTARTWEGERANHLAAKSGDYHMLQLLSAAGLDTELKNSHGFTPLQIATVNGRPLAVSTLMALKADPFVQDRRHRTLFHLAVVHGHAAVAHVLVRPIEPPKNPPGTNPEDYEEKEKKTRSKKDVQPKHGKQNDKGTRGAKKRGSTLQAKKQDSDRRGSSIDDHRRGSVKDSHDTDRRNSRLEAPLSPKSHGSHHRHSESTEPTSPVSPSSQKHHRSLDHESGDIDNHSKHNTHAKHGEGRGSVQHESHKKEHHQQHGHDDEDSMRDTATSLNTSMHDTKKSWRSAKSSNTAGKSRLSSVLSASDDSGENGQQDPFHGMNDLILKAKSLRESLPSHHAAVLSSKSAVSEKDRDGRVALSLALYFQQADLVPMLIELKADIEFTDKHGMTPLMAASAWGEPFIVDSLLLAKANIEAKDKEGRLAIEYSKSEQVRLTLKGILDKLLIGRQLAKLPRIVPKKMNTSQSAPALQKAAPGKRKGKGTSAKETHTGPVYRLRLENLPIRLPQDMLELRIKDLLSKFGTQIGTQLNPSRIAVAVDPISQRPRGHAYLDYKVQGKADIVMQAGADNLFSGWDGWDLHTGNAKVVREPVILPAVKDLQ